ncbi:MAG: protoporphyrinogen oxidase [Ignavibacteriales bacterium CG18_big_fil_WC_8_21_14_2_50_31_20]|nr:MAG: protoporphyrinogen oxidase [Ignavibacteriales bacterium CG18_big_fil_WC_8_21_14_2_50_31_20]
MNKKIVIIGAGITGLATAHWLKKDGYNVTILESNSVVGGSMVTEKENGYLIDFGPNSGLETSPLIKTLVDDLEIKDKFIYANKAGNKRYILRDNILHVLPMGLKDFIKTKLFSTKAKLRLALEPFIGKSKDGFYQSISDFVTRRLGREFLDYAINPFVAGVFAGDPDKLSVKSAFPKLYRLEELYGGLIKGTIKGARERKKSGEKSKQNAAMFSFKDGMLSLPNALYSELQNDIILNAAVTSVIKDENIYKITFNNNGVETTLNADLVISTAPSYVASNIFGKMDSELSNHLNNIYYPPVLVLYLGYDKKVIGHPLDGFGFLIPSKEKKKFLGALWSSVIFDDRAPDGKASFTLFVGGARSPELFSDDNKKLIDEVVQEFESLMRISGKHEFMKSKFWNYAIPQYNIGYIEHADYFAKFEESNKGILLGGNYTGGISVGDCIKSSEVLFNKAKERLL